MLAQPRAGVVRIDEATGRGVAVATDGSGRYTRLDPYRGAQLALAERTGTWRRPARSRSR